MMGLSAKTCSGSENSKSICESTMAERTPDSTMPASKFARMMNSRLFPVFSAATAMTMMTRK